LSSQKQVAYSIRQYHLSLLIEHIESEDLKLVESRVDIMANDSYGRKQFGNEITYCPNCGQKIEHQTTPIYTNSITDATVERPNRTLEVVTTLFLIFWFPIGLLVMWVSKPYTKKTRWIISLCFLIPAFLGFLIVLLWTSMPGYLY